jgi:hypothetical protein
MTASYVTDQKEATRCSVVPDCPHLVTRRNRQDQSDASGISNSPRESSFLGKLVNVVEIQKETFLGDITDIPP